LYLQVARGSAPRAHAFPKNPKPSLIVSVKRAPFVLQAGLPAPASVLTLPDQRWARPDIKSICLLANVLAKQAATESGAFEAVLYQADGLVTEGSSSNVWIVRPDNVVVTPPADGHILNGITRQAILDLCRRNGIHAIEYPVTLDDLHHAKEIFLTGTTTFVKPINQVDRVRLSSSTFPVTEQIALLYREFCLNNESLNRSEVHELERLCS
ncbi:MAG: aminotransferase class IV, partial [Candidatus Nucleicultricaceae bacterium]